MHTLSPHKQIERNKIAAAMRDYLRHGGKIRQCTSDDNASRMQYTYNATKTHLVPAGETTKERLIRIKRAGA